MVHLMKYLWINYGYYLIPIIFIYIYFFQIIYTVLFISAFVAIFPGCSASVYDSYIHIKRSLIYLFNFQ